MKPILARLMFAVAGLMLAVAGFAQTETPRFEVASVKPADPAANGSMMSTQNGRVRMINFTLRSMIVNAWGVRSFQVTGGPGWIDSARFDVEAKPEKPPKREDIQPMLQALLKERFQLEVRTETKEMPVYALVLARKDSKLGPQMSATSCHQFDEEHPAPAAKPGEQRAMGCGGMTMGPARLKASGALISNIAASLSGVLGRKIIDQTGLTGEYDLSLEWSPDDSRQLTTGSDRPALPEGGPTIFTALVEQLGLKLESTKAPVEMIVIEKVEKPTEN